MNGKHIWFILLFIIMGSNVLFAQQRRSPQNQQPEVIEIEARIIDARAELPQVQILDKRKQVEFDEVKVEKSFKSELSGKTEEVKFVARQRRTVKMIKDMDALLNKKRF